MTKPSVDYDDDPITYAFWWAVDGELFEGADDDEERSVVPGEHVRASSRWSCTVEASDGEDVAVVYQELRIEAAQ